jgi:hypothetical protein
MGGPMMEEKPTSKKSVIIVLLLAIVVIFVSLNWQTIYRSFAPPKPIVVSEGADNSTTTLFEYSVKVWAEIRNDGGNGTIAMEATFVQGDKTFTKTTTRYFKSLETGRMELVFDEATMLGGEKIYSIRVFPYGK